VKSTQIAMEKADDDIKGAVLASDAFFPFSWGDSVEMACQVCYIMCYITVINLLYS
jgi:phosphoribosylaminoimidazolecarboxamide formyltransferase/IMP cyclohydrolase